MTMESASLAATAGLLRRRQADLPPGPRLPPIAQMVWYVTRPVDFLERNAEAHGPTFTVRGVRSPAQVFVSRPEDIKDVFTGDPALLRAGEANGMLRPVVGASSVLLLDGATHMRQRRLLMPPFRGERLNAYTSIMIEEAERATMHWKRGDRVALRPVVQRITLDVILRTVFGADDPEEQAALGHALSRLIELGASLKVSVSQMLPMLQHDLGPLSPWGAFVRARAKADDVIYALIARRRAAPTVDRADVLSLLLSAKDEHGGAMTDRELRDELVTLLIAGHETTATTLCWLFEELLSRPDVIAEVRQELTDVCGGSSIDPEQVSKLRVLDAAIKEAMRLHPVIPGVGRVLAAPMRLAGFDLPAGVVVIPATYLTHRLPDLYPEPTRFDLRRFLDKKVDPYAWLPFGGGVRRCLGMAFALQELKAITATLLARHELRLVNGNVSKTVLRTVTHAPSGETRLRVA